MGTTSQLTAAYGGALEVNVRVRQPTEAEVASAAQKLGLASLDALLDPEALARLAVRPRPSFRVISAHHSRSVPLNTLLT